MKVASDELVIPIQSDSDIVTARQKGREVATKLGFSSGNLTLIATAISELARNIVQYARNGEMIIRIVHQSSKQGIMIIARDNGPGIQDVTQAMQDGYSTIRSLGLGLPGTKRLMDEFDISSKVGEGTIVTVTKWVK